MQIYVDLDGVLADFDSHYLKHFGIKPDKATDNVDWERIRYVSNFYADMDGMPDSHDLWEFVSQLKPAPIILTGIPSSIPGAEAQKRKWCAEYLGDHIKVITCKSRDKSLVLKDTPGAILIDDWTKYQDLWVAAGGKFIVHTSAADSIKQLLEMGIGL